MVRGQDCLTVSIVPLYHILRQENATVVAMSLFSELGEEVCGNGRPGRDTITGPASKCENQVVYRYVRGIDGYIYNIYSTSLLFGHCGGHFLATTVKDTEDEAVWYLRECYQHIFEGILSSAVEDY